MSKRLTILGKQIIIHTDRELCSSIRELLSSAQFEDILSVYCDHLERHDSPLLEPFAGSDGSRDRSKVANLLRTLARVPLDEARRTEPDLFRGFNDSDKDLLLSFVEEFYTFWRSHDRYMILHSEPGPSSFDKRPYRSFNRTVEYFEHVVRAAYRDICENVTGDHPRIYRQVAAGCDIALIAISGKHPLPEAYAESLGDIPFIRQVWIAPPMIIDPPMNKRTGQFTRVADNPISKVKISSGEWLCFPAMVGSLVMYVYFHQRFIGLGCALANLFELAGDADLAKKPDAVYLFGASADDMAEFGNLPTVFHEDKENDLLVAAVPGEDRFGYFGYLKKMILTLHNVAMMKRGLMPFHGAMVRIVLKNRRSANVLIIGDTATGKSESIEAFRIMGDEYIRDMAIVADDMGSLDVDAHGGITAYGTEIGAFIRLDDLQQGYVFTQIDRAIIMSPQKINARVVVPVTTLQEVQRGYPLDFILYANNYELVDEEHPVLERFESCGQALAVFRQGAAMAKGTTTSAGLMHTYFANIFGPPQYRELHESLADRTFDAAFQAGVFVGQIRTRLGIPGYESDGPKEAAKALFDLISSSTG